jgi:hypothetical protein
MRRRFFHHGAALAACLVLAGVSCNPALAEEATSPDDRVSHWIAQLDSPRYQVREQATQQLLSTGATALDVLTSTANGERPEPAHRAAWILRQLAETDDLALRQRVLEHLLLLKNQPQIVAEARLALAEIEHDLAILAIEQLGGSFLPEGNDEEWEQRLPDRIVLSDEWQGGDDGLDHLAQLRDMPMVIVIGTNISPQGFAKLRAVESLRFLHVYGTQLNEDDVAELQKLLPHVHIEYRGRALLGIRCLENPPVRVLKVQPNSAAEAAGVLEGDIVRKFNDQPVASFRGLTKKISQLNPGDKVSLEVMRDGKTMELEVTLGQWEAP